MSGRNIGIWSGYLQRLHSRTQINRSEANVFLSEHLPILKMTVGWETLDVGEQVYNFLNKHSEHFF